MATEVANLVTRLSFAVDGAAQAAAQVRAFTDQMERAKQIGPSTAAELRNTADNLGLVGRRAQESQTRLARAATEFSRFGVSVNEARQQIAAAQTSTADYEAELEQLRDKTGKSVADFNRMNELIALVEKGSTELTGETKALAEAYEELAQAQEAAVRSEGTSLRAQDQAARKMQEVQQSVQRVNQSTSRLSREGFTALLASFRSGRISATLMSRAMYTLVAAGGKLLAIFAPLAVLGGTVFAAFKIANSGVGQLAQSISSARPEIQGMVNDLSDLEGASAGVLAQNLSRASARFRSIGARRPDALAGQVAEITEIAQFLQPGAGDYEQVFQQIQQAIESVDFSPLRDAGFAVDEYNSQLQRLASEGLSQAEQRQFVLNAIIAESNQRLPEAMGAATREAGTMASLMTEIKRIWDSIAQSPEFQAAIERLVGTLRDALPVIEAIVNGLAEAARLTVHWGANIAEFVASPLERAGLIITEQMGRTLESMARGLADLSGREDIEALADSFGAWADNVDHVSRRSIPDYDAALSAAEAQTNQFKTTTEDATRAIEAWKLEASQRTAEFGLLDSARGLADAFRAMDEDLNFSTVQGTLQSFDRMLSQVLENGTGQIELLRLQAERLNEVGLLPDDALRESERMFEALEYVIQPIEREAARIKDRMTEQQGAQAGVTTAVGGTNAALAESGGIIANNIALTHQWAGAVQGVMGAGFTLGNPLGIPGFGGSGSSAGEFQVNPKGPRPSTGSGNTFSPEAARMGRGRGASPTAPRDFRDWLDLFGTPQAGGAGGGGGGGAAKQAASIEEIRQLFRNINQLIKIGTNEGVFFSPAGNTIPRGGPNEFLNREGGVLVQTVNIRGIWDFADPAAKRQIIKELEEALAGLKSEVQ